MIKNIILVFSLILLLSACSDKQEHHVSGKSIKVGVLVPMTGENKRFSQQSVLGLQAAQKMKKYLNNGDEIVFEIRDTKSTQEGTQKAFKELQAKDVKVIMALLGSDNVLAIKEQVSKSEIPTIVTIATSSFLTSADGFISQVCMNNSTQSIVASHYIRDEKFYQNVGVVYDKNSHYSTSLAKEFRDDFIKIGGKIIFFLDVSDTKGIQEFNNISHSGIEMIFNTTNSILTMKLLKILKKKKSKIELLGSDGLLSNAIHDSKNDLHLLNGVYVLDHYAHDVHKGRKQKKFQNSIGDEKYKHSSYAFLSYDGYQLLTYAFEKCPQYSKECINKHIKNSDVIKGISGNFSMQNYQSKRNIYVDKIEKASLKKEVVIY